MHIIENDHTARFLKYFRPLLNIMHERVKFYKLKLVLFCRPATLLKRDSSTDVLCEYCESFKNSFFYRTPPVAAFDHYLTHYCLVFTKRSDIFK